MKKLLLLCAFITMAFTSCEKEEDVIVTTMRVNSYQETCQALVEWKCLLVQTGEQVGSEDWDRLYFGIEGFEYEEGFLYTLKVKIEEVADPLQDGSSQKFILLEVVSKEKV